MLDNVYLLPGQIFKSGQDSLVDFTCVCFSIAEAMDRKTNMQKMSRTSLFIHTLIQCLLLIYSIISLYLTAMLTTLYLLYTSTINCPQNALAVVAVRLGWAHPMFTRVSENTINMQASI